LILDEIQCGLGRTGRLFAHEHAGITPDIMTLAKALGGGLPIGAMCATERVAAAFTPGVHGSTFGGNPVACAAALVVLDEVERDEFRARSEELGQVLRARLDEIAARFENVGEVRGLGPMLALELVADPETKEPAAELTKRTTEAARERGLILLSCGLYGNVVRILVPLVIADDDLDRGLEILEESLVHAAAG
jgi:4-aminobutyrate aminotransferase / (S)-3-amino-2-methylpropionate transaminase / 5-aminovalerate transaminase